jgi:hypothetical protein
MVQVHYKEELMAAKKGRGLLMVYVDVPDELEEEFNRWYNEEHIAERLSIPGVLNAARYVAVRGGPKHLACYELAEPEAYFSDIWQHHLNHPTAWSQRMAPTVVGRNFVRNLYRLIYPPEVSQEIAQADMSPALLVGRMAVPPALEEAFNQAYNTERLPLYHSIPGYTRARRFTAVTGEPKYTTVHECETAAVADSPAWEAVRKAHTPVWSGTISAQMTFAPGSPGVYRRIFPPVA